MKGAKEAIERSYGKGAYEVLQKATINFGTIHGGLKVNMIPGQVKIDADVRLPVGLKKEFVLSTINKILTKFPQVRYQEINYNAPNFCEPDTDFVKILQRNIEYVRGHKAEILIALGGTDTRLWRYEGIPAYIYGPYPHNMGSTNEYVEVEEFIDVVKVHVLSSFDYLSNQMQPKI
jgi:succinyl-diaminopimelate desuccinylase